MSKNNIHYGLSAEQRGRRNRFGEKDYEYRVVMFRLRCLREPGSVDFGDEGLKKWVAGSLSDLS